MPSIRMQCQYCTREFEITEGEQAFYRQLGINKNFPPVCPECQEKQNKKSMFDPLGVSLEH